MKRWIAIGLLIFGGLNMANAENMGMHVHEHAVSEVQNRYGKQFARFAGEMDIGMAKMMLDMHTPGYTGNTDIDFLEMMISHHEGAVDMAQLILQFGRNPVTRKLAEDIIASQQVEIESMKRRLNNLKHGASRTYPEDYPALGGTRGGS